MRSPFFDFDAPRAMLELNAMLLRTFLVDLEQRGGIVNGWTIDESVTLLDSTHVVSVVELTDIDIFRATFVDWQRHMPNTQIETTVQDDSPLIAIRVTHAAVKDLC